MGHFVGSGLRKNLDDRCPCARVPYDSSRRRDGIGQGHLSDVNSFMLTPTGKRSESDGN